MTEPGCSFCTLIRASTSDLWLFEDESALAFLDRSPVFLGHTLVIPRQHHETLDDLPAELVAAFFGNVQRMTRAVEMATESDGTFVAMNNRVSQSVPHLHVHIVPRRRGDGLRGFFWPRRRYQDDDERAQYAARIREAIGGLQQQPPGRPGTTLGR